MTGSERELSWLRRACDLSHQLVDVRDPQRLLPLILDSAIELANAERGFLIRLVEGAISVEVARGFDGTTLAADSSAVSRRVVQQVLASGEGLVTLDENQALLDGTTIQAKRVLAILCVPMRLRGEIVGAIYLDHRFLKDPFLHEDLGPLKLFADQAALTIEMAELAGERVKAQEELARAEHALAERQEADERSQRLLSGYRSLEGGGGERFGSLIGQSAAAQRLFEEIERSARSNDPLLVTGETGSGKSSVARELHRLALEPGPLVTHACASLDSAQLLASLNAPLGGILVLDGIEDASPELQATLVTELRRELAPDSRVRLVTTGSPDLHTRIREDLYFRLAVFQIEVPPLRERREDVALLLSHTGESEGSPLKLTPNALQLLVDHSWPGNVLELEGLARRLCGLKKKVTRRDLPSEVRDPRKPSGQGTMADMEQRMVQEALEACQGNKAQAARQLGIQRSTLYRILSRK
ncbi:MAG: sigma-54-dependent Fis family transcriptional regulator [Planctomycetes bacterium]|nr:sigma-54-dependent Fis family transcriptional regulator [Planctomycetota bacterium]